MYPSLSALAIDKSYTDVLREENDNNVDRTERRLQDTRSRGITKPVRPNVLRAAQNALDRARGKTRALESWLALDFGTRPMPRFEDLFTNLSNIVRASTQKPVSPYFDVASFTNDADQQQQIKLLDDTYNAYVTARTNSEQVARWVQERGEDGDAAPHEILTLYMLRQARVTSRKDEMIAMDIDPFEPLANRSRLRAWANALYTLLIEAPRTTEPILLVRSVRSAHRSPTAWFRTATGSPMNTGNAIVLPTFWATSTLDQASNWLQHGPPALQTDDPTEVEDETCCMLLIAVPAGIPVLPLYDFKANDEHAHEHEVLLPPGIELVFCGMDEYQINGSANGANHTYAMVEQYVVRLPTYDGQAP